MKTRTCKVLTIGKLTRNGRLYTKEYVQSALDKELFQTRLKNKQLFVYSGADGGWMYPSMEDVIGIVESVELTDDALRITYTTVDTPLGKQYEERKIVRVTAVGSGYIAPYEEGQLLVDQYCIDYFVTTS